MVGKCKESCVLWHKRSFFFEACSTSPLNDACTVIRKTLPSSWDIRHQKLGFQCTSFGKIR